MSGLRMNLYGLSTPEIVGLMRDDAFRAWVRQLFASGEIPVPEEASALLERALHHGLLVADGGRCRPGSRLVLVPAVAEGDLAALLAPALERYVGVAAAVVDELEEAYSHTAVSHRFPWPEVSHAVSAGMFLDLAMGGELIRAGEIQRQVDETVVWAFEQISAENSLGVELSGAQSEERLVFAQLWHCRLTRPSVRLTEAHRRLLASLAADVQRAALDPESRLYLGYLGLLRKVESAWRPGIPYFGPADSERLLPLLRRGAAQLVRSAVVPALDLLAGHPWWGDRAADDRYRHAAVRLILEYGIDRVVAAGLLAPFPEQGKVVAAWGRWLWQDPPAGLSLVPGRDREEA